MSVSWNRGIHSNVMGNLINVTSDIHSLSHFILLVFNFFLFFWDFFDQRRSLGNSISLCSCLPRPTQHKNKCTSAKKRSRVEKVYLMIYRIASWFAGLLRWPGLLLFVCLSLFWLPIDKYLSYNAQKINKYISARGKSFQFIDQC